MALLAAARSTRALNTKTAEQADTVGILNPRTYFRVENGKANLAPPPEKADWYQLQAVPLQNGNSDLDDGDKVAVVTPWPWPDMTAGVTAADLRKAQAAVARSGAWRENVQSSSWVGKPIAEALRIDISNKGGKKKVSSLLKMWMGTGMFVSVMAKDDHGDMRPFVEVGEWATE